MGRTQRWAEAHHVHVRIYRSNDAALEPGVDYTHFLVLAKEFLVDFHHSLYDRRFGIGLPCRIIAVVRYLHACHGKCAPHCVGTIAAHAVAGRAHEHTGFGQYTYQEIDGFYSINLPSFGITNKDGEYNDPGTGYVVEVYDDTVVFKARDFGKGIWLPDYDLALPIK